MRTNAHKLKDIVMLTVDQDEIGPDVAITMISPVTRQRMIGVAAGKGSILGQQEDGFIQKAIKSLAVPS